MRRFCHRWSGAATAVRPTTTGNVCLPYSRSWSQGLAGGGCPRGFRPTKPRNGGSRSGWSWRPFGLRGANWRIAMTPGRGSSGMKSCWMAPRSPQKKGRADRSQSRGSGQVWDGAALSLGCASQAVGSRSDRSQCQRWRSNRGRVARPGGPTACGGVSCPVPRSPGFATGAS